MNGTSIEVAYNKGNELKATVTLPASKSISNRLLIMNALANDKIRIANLSDSSDTNVLQATLQQYLTKQETDVGAAGTAFRFLTAFLALNEYKGVLTGSQRMLERPIGGLVQVLQEMGADIVYLNEKGFPPLEFKGGKLKGGAYKADARESSQYISALLLISPYLEGGLELDLKGNKVSESYIETTIALMEMFGVKVKRLGNKLLVKQGEYRKGEISVEADWSAASYFFQMAALSKNCKMLLKGLHQNSIQADSVLPEWFKSFGVITSWQNDGLKISKDNNIKLKSQYEFDCIQNPDLAQTLAFTCAGLGVGVRLTGLQTLRIKETDRLIAIKTELEKFEVEVQIESEDSLFIAPQPLRAAYFRLNTYNDHRMAMAMAPLALKTGAVCIESPEVVEKSFPGYWNEIKRLGFEITITP